VGWWDYIGGNQNSWAKQLLAQEQEHLKPHPTKDYGCRFITWLEKKYVSFPAVEVQAWRGSANAHSDNEFPCECLPASAHYISMYLWHPVTICKQDDCIDE